MAIEVIDVLQQNVEESTSEPSETPAPESAAPELESAPVEPEPVAPEPKRRGRPPGAKDKQPRRRVPKAEVIEDIEDPPIQSPKKKAKRVQIAYESPESQDDLTPPPTPRTAHRNQWRAYREQQVSHHQSRVAHYANIFDRMLA